jgi:ElaB/YqjD/DUF883 family membrane-anchored ribosome-binding protein
MPNVGFIPFRTMLIASIMACMNTEDIKEQAQDVTDSAQEWADEAVEQASKAESTARECVTQNPWTSLGVATVVGVLIGFGIGKVTERRRLEVEPA